MTGTPSDLRKSIMNGLAVAANKTRWTAEQWTQFESLNPAAQLIVCAELQDQRARLVEDHVLDRLRQDFGVAYLRIEEVRGLAGDDAHDRAMEILDELAARLWVRRAA